MREVTRIKNMEPISERPDIEAAVFSVKPSYCGFDYLRISAATPSNRRYPETFAFGCDSDGEVLDWRELPCSVTGVHDIEMIATKVRNS